MRTPQDQEGSQRFAILTHDHPFFHWDLLLEAGEVAWTWRLLDDPATEESPRSERIGDHRLMYLNYEGPVSGGRGLVTAWDVGTYRVESNSDRELTVTLNGRRGTRTLALPL
ncbi:MAG: hypothetical protein IT565_14420 [Rhodospirillales bacterium]|nr:hypothetical protein [Rhodospirillales bacterium]